MKFKPGKPKTGGRQKGTPNAKTREFMIMLQENDFDPGEAMVYCYNQLLKIYDTRHKTRAYAAAVDAITSAGKLANDISSYAYPKKKAIEHSGEVGVKTYADFAAAAAAKKKINE